MSGTDYIPRKGDVVALDFEPSKGREIRKRRPALVISNQRYSILTGLVIVLPITHAENNTLVHLGFFVGVNCSHVDGYVNTLQIHSFDFKKRQAQYLDTLDSESMRCVLQRVNQMINANEQS
ncbi:type II toxin-antitoxin system PemK/MazF family toxin [Aerococcus christensenii]|uniref:Toxin-antitoxin system, toxin component, MazF family n=1 Tax=Aerococcus christensenii TaxID=87541 RepID=A0A133XSX5_9LACT|nr:type II toxin-antitoxin system PemK/MazF family toxin [Aerococcus christensenii]KXB34042.1 toxin-antitoxin system, toxin component, MazF family [Aerococcus christensenii]MDK8234657.1 type II toxin-antitoxin system PemK/MazF family toxin [Aerococcus christensenii]DAP05831.1 MAG TPA: PemK-like protein [Caudoviricetes sp.]